MIARRIAVIHHVMQLRKINIVKSTSIHFDLFAIDPEIDAGVCFDRDMETNLSECEICHFMADVTMFIDPRARIQSGNTDAALRAMKRIQKRRECREVSANLSPFHLLIWSGTL
jgi:uncharacterized protein YjaG (DUF416 family)